MDAWASEMSEGRVLEGWRAGQMSRNVVPGRTMDVKASTWAFEERKDTDPNPDEWRWCFH